MKFQIRDMDVLENVDQIDMTTHFRLIEIANKAQELGASISYLDIYRMISKGLIVEKINRYKCVSLKNLLAFKALKTLNDMDEALLLDWIYFLKLCILEFKSKEMYLKKTITQKVNELIACQDAVIESFLLEYACIKTTKHNYIDLLIAKQKINEAILILTFVDLSLQYNLERQAKNKEKDEFWKQIIAQNVAVPEEKDENNEAEGVQNEEK